MIINPARFILCSKFILSLLQTNAYGRYNKQKFKLPITMKPFPISTGIAAATYFNTPNAKSY
jgi:hypothetical protein